MKAKKLIKKIKELNQELDRLDGVESNSDSETEYFILKRIINYTQELNDRYTAKIKYCPLPNPLVESINTSTDSCLESVLSSQQFINVIPQHTDGFLKINKLPKFIRTRNELGGANVQAHRLVFNSTTKDGVTTTTTIIKDKKIK